MTINITVTANISGYAPASPVDVSVGLYTYIIALPVVKFPDTICHTISHSIKYHINLNWCSTCCRRVVCHIRLCSVELFRLAYSSFLKRLRENRHVCVGEVHRRFDPGFDLGVRTLIFSDSSTDCSPSFPEAPVLALLITYPHPLSYPLMLPYPLSSRWLEPNT